MRRKIYKHTFLRHQAAGIDECLFLDAFGLDADIGDVAFSHQ